VLLGLAIFLIAIVAIGRLVDIGTDNALEAMLMNDGTRLAQSKLAEVESGAISLSGGGSGTCDDEPSWSWAVDSSPATLPNLYTVTVTLTHDLNGRPLTVTLTQNVFDPQKMGTAASIPKPTATSGTTGTTGAAAGGTTP
jgi:hypothetical protein